jgi:RNA polymerase sigma-70 factor (ECF subfamily)
MTADDKVVLQQCMEVLSDTERQIVVLHAVSGFKHREIAAYLELPLATVLSKYHRAIKKMKTML